MRTSEVDDAIAVLQRALARCGVQLSPWALMSACGDDFSLASFARCARQQGLETTILSVSQRDAQYLPLGSIVAADQGRLMTVTGHQPGCAILQTASGSRERVGPNVGPEIRSALELRAPVKDGRFASRTVARLRSDPRAVRACVVFAIVATATAALALASPILMHVALGAAIPERADSTLTLVAFGIALAGVQLAWVRWLRSRALLYLSTRLSELASVDVVTHLARLPFAKQRAFDMGYVRQAAMSSATAAEALPVVVPQLVDAALSVGFLAYTVYLDTFTGLAAAVAGAIIFVSGHWNGRRRLEKKRALLERTRAEHRALFETIIGIETVKSESIEEPMLKRWLQGLVAEERAALDVRLTASTFDTVLVAIERITFVVALLMMAHRCLMGRASLADVVVALQSSVAFLASMRKLTEAQASLSDYRSDVERVEQALAFETESDGGADRPPEGNMPAIMLRDVWFRYDPESAWVVRGLNLTVQPGEVAMLSWPSGAGKSTLLRLLSGLLAPSRGDVLVFGVEAAQARRMITYIPQQATLFPLSVMDNLRILSRGAKGRVLQAASEKTGLFDLVSKWPMGVETVLAAGGANLSAGQRQLILLTAAVAANTPFVLLDEALAHMDLRMRSRLDIAKLFEGRTVISVVHDASDRERDRARIVEMQLTAGSPTRTLESGG